jgi:hypothetical protein
MTPVCGSDYSTQNVERHQFSRVAEPRFLLLIQRSSLRFGPFGVLRAAESAIGPR